METLFEILQSLFVTGFGMWNIVLFLQYRKLKKAQAISDTRQVWHKIAESNNEALLQQNEEIKRLRQAVNTFERIVLRAHACPYYNTCPIRTELQKLKGHAADDDFRQYTNRPKSSRRPRDCPDEPCCAADTDE